MPLLLCRLSVLGGPSPGRTMQQFGYANIWFNHIPVFASGYFRAGVEYYREDKGGRTVIRAFSERLATFCKGRLATKWCTLIVSVKTLLNRQCLKCLKNWVQLCNSLYRSSYLSHLWHSSPKRRLGFDCNASGIIVGGTSSGIYL